jgi:hypothetical protein
MQLSDVLIAPCGFLIGNLMEVSVLEFFERDRSLTTVVSGFGPYPCFVCNNKTRICFPSEPPLAGLVEEALLMVSNWFRAHVNACRSVHSSNRRRTKLATATRREVPTLV